MGDDGNNYSDCYTFEAVMFCTESNLHGQNFLNACLIRIERMGEEKNITYSEYDIKKKEEKKEKNNFDYFLTEEGEKNKKKFRVIIIVIFLCLFISILISFFSDIDFCFISAM